MTRYNRRAELDSRIDTDTGEFEMVMATEGEASDGHIIGIGGLEFGADFPLQLDHGRATVSNLGTVSNIRRDRIDGVPVYRGVGRIRLTGDGEALSARRDLVDAISRGDIRGTSLSWEATKVTERRELPRNHPAYVSRSEKDPRRRFGLFFEKSIGIEQSIVAIPADREALIGRAESAEDDFSRAMWKTLVDRFDDAPRSREAEIIDALEGMVETLEERVRVAEANASSDTTPDALPNLDFYLESLEADIGRSSARRKSELADALGRAYESVTGKRYDETYESRTKGRTRPTT